MNAPENKFFDSLDAELWDFTDSNSYTLIKKTSYIDLVGGVKHFQKHFYWYMGSLSIPPCTEHVFRFVMKVPIKVRGSQFDPVKEKAYPHEDEPKGNSRSAKPMLNRMVYYHVDTSVDCAPDELVREIEKIKEDESPVEPSPGQIIKAETKFHTYGMTYDTNLPNVDLGNGVALNYVNSEEVPMGIRTKLESEFKPVQERVIKTQMKKYNLEAQYRERETVYGRKK